MPCRFYVSEVACTAWVQENTEEAFNAVRELARGVVQRAGDKSSPGSQAALALAGLRGIPREISIGDPGRLQLTWTIERYEPRDIPPTAFELPVDFRQDPETPASLYTLPEHLYFLAEASAAYFARPGQKAPLSLLPRRFTITDPQVLKTFYEGKADAEAFEMLRWAEPLTFYLAPDLWCYPLSGRIIDLMLVIGTANQHGGLARFPRLNALKPPAP